MKPETQYEAVFQVEFLEDLGHWMQTDRRIGLKLLSLVKATLKDPFDGIGKPEQLRQFSGDVWSRRVTQEHRLVYQVQGKRIQYLQGRYHY